MVSLLLEHGADAKSIGAGRWVLHPELAPMLSRAGAEVERSGAWIGLCCTDNQGRKDDPEYVRALLRHGARVGNKRLVGQGNDGGRATALHYAAKGDFVKTIQVLLEHGAGPSAADDNGLTPLDWLERAAKSVDRAQVRRLLSRPARAGGRAGSVLRRRSPPARRDLQRRSRAETARGYRAPSVVSCAPQFGNDHYRASRPRRASRRSVMTITKRHVRGGCSRHDAIGHFLGRQRQAFAGTARGYGVPLVVSCAPQFGNDHYRASRPRRASRHDAIGHILSANAGFRGGTLGDGGEGADRFQGGDLAHPALKLCALHQLGYVQRDSAGRHPWARRDSFQ